MVDRASGGWSVSGDERAVSPVIGMMTFFLVLAAMASLTAVMAFDFASGTTEDASLANDVMEGDLGDADGGDECNEEDADHDKGHGNDCDGVDEDNPGTGDGDD